MKPVFLLVSSLFLAPAYATADEAFYDLSTSIGYREDNFDWNIASDPSGTATPNILSELEWENLKMAEIRGEGKATHPDGPQLRAAIGYALTLDGENQDSDYYGDDRTMEFSRSNNSSGDGDALDISLAAGWRLGIGDAWDCRCMTGLSVTPLIGWSWNEIEVRMNEGKQTVSAYGNETPLGEFDGLDSSYEVSMHGPWVGVEVAYDRPTGLSGYMRAEYHKSSYEAEADWNLRSDFQHPKSYEHETDMDGQIFAAGLKYINAQKTLTYKLEYRHRKWEGDPGRDTTFFSDGASSSTRLNEVNWESSSISVGLEFYF